MLWLMWIGSIFIVIGTQIYTTQTVIRTRFKLEGLQKRAAAIKMEEKIAKGNLEITKRGLVEVNNKIRNQVEGIEKTRQVIKTFEENQKKKREAAKKSLLG